MSIKRLIIIPFFFLSFQYLTFASPGGPIACDDTQRSNNTICVDGVGAGAYAFDNARIAAGNFSTTAREASQDDDSGTALFGDSNLKGLAAGDHLAGWGFWASVSQTDFQARLPIALPIASLAYEGDTYSVLAGADKLIMNNLVVGVAIGYEDTEVFTFYNGGHNDSAGLTVVPYMAYLINDNLSVDAAIGYTDLEYDTDRVSITTAGTTVTGNYDADRLFASVNLNALTAYNNWYFNGRIGLLYTEEEQDAYAESTGGFAAVGQRNIDLTQLQVGVEAAYNFEALEPYISLTYADDLSSDTGGVSGGPAGPGPGPGPGPGAAVSFSDDDELQVGFGLRAFGDGFTVILDAMAILDRDNFDSHSVMLTFRGDM